MSHDHNIVDMDTYFSIDPVTKAVTTIAEKTTLVQGTHNSERFTFQIPRVIEGHDMSQSDRIEVHFTNYSTDKRQSNGDVYLVKDVVAKDEAVVFSWVVSRNATGIVGTLQFSVNFICVDDEDNVVYEWPTDIFKGIKVVERIHNTAAVLEEYPDLIAGLIGDDTDIPVGAGLPEVTAENDGDVLAVDEGAWTNVTPRLTVASDGYTDIAGLRQPTAISMTRSGTTVTITVTLQGSKTSTTTITLNDADRPTQFTSNGVTGTISMGGFDD